MADALDLYRARSQLMAHASHRGPCCTACDEARKLLDEAAAEHRRELIEAGERWLAEQAPKTSG